MNKICNRIISLVLSLLIVSTAFYTPAFAATVSENYGSYSSFAELNGWTVGKQTAYQKVEMKNGGLQITQTKSKYYASDVTSRNTATSTELNKAFSGIVEENTAARSRLETLLVGKVEIDINYTVDIKDNDYSGNPYYNLTFPGYGYIRIYNGKIVVLNASSLANNTMTFSTSAQQKNSTISTNAAGVANSIKVTIDTKNNTFAVTVNGNSSLSASGVSEYKNQGKTPTGYFEKMNVKTMERMPVDAYLRFNSVSYSSDMKISDVEISDQTQEMLDSLPDSIADDPYNVTENVTLPSDIAGILWQSTNADVLSTFGYITNTGNVPAEVQIYTELPAKINNKETYVKKVYSLTVNATRKVSNTNTVNPNSGNEEKWYSQPENVDGHEGYPMYSDPKQISDSSFFGVWDSSAQKWKVSPYFRYETYPDMANVEQAAKEGDYETAKAELLKYYRGVASNRVSAITSKPDRNSEVTYELLSRNAYATSFISGEAIDVFSVSKSWGDVKIDVTDQIKSAKGSYAIFSNMVASIDKYKNQAEIYSKDSDYEPVLVVKVNGNEKTFKCVKDATIRGGNYANTNYGAEKIMYVEESGTWQNYDDRVKRVFLGFDISSLKRTDTVESAYVKLRARHTGSDDTKLLLYYWYNDGSWVEDEVCWDTFSDPLYFSCNDMECWDYVTSSNVTIKGKVCGYHRDVEPAKVANLYSYYSNHTDLESDPDKYAYTYLRQYLGLINSIGTNTNVMNQLDMSTHISGVSQDILRLISSKYMTPDVFTAYLKHLWNLTEYHTYYWYGVSTNNFASFSTGAVYNMCARFPEFARHDAWYNETVSENKRIISGFVFDDGLCLELSHNYISTILGTIATPVSTSKKTGEPLPFGEGTEDIIYDMVLSLFNTSGPYFGGFNFGDGYDPYTSYTSTFKTWYNSMFKSDPTIAYMATSGASGWLPDDSTTNYPTGQRTYMRSDWSQNALALGISNKMVGSHGHRDALNLAMFAYGKYLITDQGYGSIQTGTTANYMRSPQQHNVVTVNDYADYLTTGDYSSFSTVEVKDGKQLAFDSNNQYDFTEYTTPAYKQTENSQRSVMFLKNQKFWIVTDYLVPTSPSNQNVYAQNWHLYPGANMTIDSESKIIESHFDGEPNVMIVPVSPDDIDKTEIRDTWYSEKGGQLTDSQKGMLYKTKTGNTVYSTIILPMDVGESYSVSTEKLSCGFDENEVNCFSFGVTDKVTKDKNNYYYYHLNDASKKTGVTVGNYQTDAETMVVQEDSDGNFVSAYLLDATYLNKGTAAIFTSSEECESVAFTKDGDVLDVHFGNRNIKTIESCKFSSSLGSKVTYLGDDVKFSVTDGMMAFTDVSEKDESVAGEPFAGKVIADSSVNPELVKWTYTQSDKYKTTDMGKDGIKFENLKSEPYKNDGSINSTFGFSAGVHVSGVVGEDTQNQTRTVTDCFSGKYALEFTVAHNIDTERHVLTYATLCFGTPGSAKQKCSTNLTEIRLMPTYLQAIRYANTQKDGVRNDVSNISLQELKADSEWKLRVEFDTVKHTYTVYVNDVLERKIVDYPYNVKYDSEKGTYTEYSVNFVPDFFISLMDASSVGSYVWVKNVKLYEIERNDNDSRVSTLDAKILNMPQKLVENPLSVVSSFSVPTVSGMVWSSSNGDVISADGVLAEDFNETDVTLSLDGTFKDTDTSTVFNFGRTYKMTAKPSNWSVDIGFADGEATVSVENSLGNYSACPMMILAAYDSDGNVCATKAFKITEKTDSLKWDVGDDSAVEVKSVIVDGLDSFRPLRQIFKSKSA